jgi:hypothetical protein
MGYKHELIDDVGTMNGFAGKLACATDWPRRGCLLDWPPDALTRLLMQADDVTEDALDSLLRRIVAVRVNG